MERRVKERLVGAAVLMAAAIILIPEMLSGRKPETTAVAPSDESFKTYTIDLSRSPGALLQSTPIEESAPPPEGPSVDAPSAAQGSADHERLASETVAPAHEGSPESAAVEVAPSPDPTVAARSPTTEPPRSIPVQPAASPPRSIEKTQASPIAPGSSVPTSRGWAVQLGSFSSRATADRMVKDLVASGQNAFVMPVKSGANTLYRVRIGPFADRAAANEALMGIKKRVANAAVVAHP